jgi:hypothetical protein
MMPVIVDCHGRRSPGESLAAPAVTLPSRVSLWVKEYKRALTASARTERLAADLRRVALLKADYT